MEDIGLRSVIFEFTELEKVRVTNYSDINSMNNLVQWENTFDWNHKE